MQDITYVRMNSLLPTTYRKPNSYRVPDENDNFPDDDKPQRGRRSSSEPATKKKKNVKNTKCKMPTKYKSVCLPILLKCESMSFKDLTLGFDARINKTDIRVQFIHTSQMGDSTVTSSS